MPVYRRRTEASDVDATDTAADERSHRRVYSSASPCWAALWRRTGREFETFPRPDEGG